MSEVEDRVRELACEWAGDYPGIDLISTWEQLYALEGTLKGMNEALEDWNYLLGELQKKGLVSTKTVKEIFRKRQDPTSEILG